MSLYSDLTCTAAYLHSSVSTFLHIIALDTKFIRQLMQFTCEASMDDAIIQTSSIVCLLVRPYLTTCAYTMVVFEHIVPHHLQKERTRVLRSLPSGRREESRAGVG